MVFLLLVLPKYPPKMPTFAANLTWLAWLIVLSLLIVDLVRMTLHLCNLAQEHIDENIRRVGAHALENADRCQPDDTGDDCDDLSSPQGPALWDPPQEA